MRIIIKRLSSGYYHIRGQGPCNWSQPHQWPCSEEELRAASFQKPSEEFIRSAMGVLEV